MKKGQLTKEMILQRAAALFNTEGYAKASLSDIMTATGLEKGGIYNHFQSKDQLMLEAFDFAVRCSYKRIKELVDAQSEASAKLMAIVEYFCQLAKNPPVPGGCPVLNTAIESDDSEPELRIRAREAMKRFTNYVEGIVETGIKSGEFHRDNVTADGATLMIASLEGSLMLTKLFGNSLPLKSAARFWTEEIKGWKTEGKRIG